MAKGKLMFADLVPSKVSVFMINLFGLKCKCDAADVTREISAWK